MKTKNNKIDQPIRYWFKIRRANGRVEKHIVEMTQSQILREGRVHFGKLERGDKILMWNPFLE